MRLTKENIITLINKAIIVLKKYMFKLKNKSFLDSKNLLILNFIEI